METIKAEPKSLVRKVIQVTPEQLIETGQKLRQWAMDQATPGDVVLLELTDSISVLWHPTEEYLRHAPRV